MVDAPFPYFGGKRRVAADVWAHFGDVANYVEPFAGSLAVLLGRPKITGSETVNDLDGMIANFWRAIKADPDAVAEWADNPVNENDLHARHVWLVKRLPELSAYLNGDPDYYDPKIAGYWCYGINSWIGSGFCSGKGPWWTDAEGRLVHRDSDGDGVSRKLVHLGGDRGVHRQRVHLGNDGYGVHRQLVHLGNEGTNGGSRLLPWFRALADRLARVRVCSGDWARVCGPSVTFKHGMTAVFLDPPYADTAERDSDLYREDSLDVAHDVREWAIENGENPLMRIALCGYENEHAMPESWSVVEWKAKGGYGNQSNAHPNPNAHRERIWYSPACLGVARQASLFEVRS